MCLCCYRRGTSRGRSSQWAGKITWCKLKDRQRSEQKRRCSDRQTGDSYSTSKHPSHLSAIRGRTRRVIWNRTINISIIQIQLTFGSYLWIKVTSVQKGNKDNRWQDGQKDKERDEERKGETALCGRKTDCIPGYGTATGKTHTWQTEVMFTLIMLLMNWKQEDRK